MAAFALIGFSIGVDLYNVGVRCLKSGFSISNIISALTELHDEIRVEKYLESIEEIYANQKDSDYHSIGIQCFSCRERNKKTKMMCNEIENALEVDRCDEAFEVISSDEVSAIGIYQVRKLCDKKFQIKCTDSN